ncbi:MAG TPA: sigma-70 family RNA polymerase sigma factor [Acidimicrobiales bacterium]|nr:sigma-70 family RNA polymerase sigma factor [Acidimicrobiales bacterium]
MEWPPELVLLYEREYRSLVQQVYMLLGNRSEAEEIVQDAVLTMCQKWSSVDHPAAYLRRSVVNGGLGRLRRREAAARRRPDPPPAGEPAHLVELHDVLLRLPERQRAAIVLRYVADLADDEIAQILTCRRATVRSLVARGLTSLRLEVARD